MRVLLSAALAACLMLVTTPAGADSPNWLTPPSKQLEVTPWNRTGAYVGLTAGLGVAALQAEEFKFADQSYLGGIFGGFNVRIGDIIVGIEADYLLTAINASTTDGFVTLVAKTDYLASVRGRVGLPIGPALIYATAGPAFTEHKLAIAPLAISSNETLMGGVFGGGIEASLTKTLFVRLEGLHYIFPDKDIPCGGGCFFESKDQQTTVRVGLGFKLN